MNPTETKQLGIEFERRLNSIDSRTMIDDKPDTDTIYAYLNRAQDRLFKALFLATDQMQTGSKLVSRSEHILSTLLHSVTVIYSDPVDLTSIRGIDVDKAYKIDRVAYKASSTYNWTSGGELKEISGVEIKQSDVAQFTKDAYDQHRIIRTPMYWIDYNSKLIHTIKDDYSNFSNIIVWYYKKPNEFTILGNNPQNCELPIECFDELVTEAVQMYVQEKYKVSLAEQQQKQQKQQNDNNQAEEQ